MRALLGVSTDAATADPATPDEPAGSYAWEMATPHDADIAPLGHRLLRALSQRVQWKTALMAARDRAAQLAADVAAAVPLTASDSKETDNA